MEVTKSAVAGTVSNGLAQAGLTVKHRLHGAVLGKDAVPGRPVPIYLGVKVVAIQFLCSRLGIVVGVGCSGSQSRNKSQDLGRDGIYGDGGLVGKGCASGAVRVSCVWVIDNSPGAGKVSGANSGSRQRDKPGIAIVTFVGAVVASEEEQLVLLDGATESAAKIIKLTVSFWASLKELLCPQSLVLKVLKTSSMVLIGAGLGNDGDGRASRHPLLGIEIICRNVDFLYSLPPRDINGMVRQADEHVRGAVHAGVIVVAVGTIDVRAQGAFRGVGDSVLKSSRSRAGHEIDQCLEIPVLVERHVEDGLLAELRVYVTLFGLQIHDGCLDNDLFGHRAHL